ncbi:MAG: hypothetical protein A7316_04020 [Candidatus Altiarchaeales archaeon WOR_SM1_86-2]|nr:MAG: hypothetical protein A7316_04020 [Candidatus Altiarchaeales archaeon WOR_SM1_86-2]ODS40028.1 MAG: hypothetical protein A7315_09985 [Candidatus Altiarchaeales archaeon WOR_SM1_79]
MLIDSNPFDAGDPNLDDMIEVDASDISDIDLPEGKDVYCYIKSCCVVNLGYGGVVVSGT